MLIRLLLLLYTMRRFVMLPTLVKTVSKTTESVENESLILGSVSITSSFRHAASRLTNAKSKKSIFENVCFIKRNV